MPWNSNKAFSFRKSYWSVIHKYKKKNRFSEDSSSPKRLRWCGSSDGGQRGPARLTCSAELGDIDVLSQQPKGDFSRNSPLSAFKSLLPFQPAFCGFSPLSSATEWLGMQGQVRWTLRTATRGLKALRPLSQLLAARRSVAVQTHNVTATKGWDRRTRAQEAEQHEQEATLMWFCLD